MLLKKKTLRKERIHFFLVRYEIFSFSLALCVLCVRVTFHSVVFCYFHFFLFAEYLAFLINSPFGANVVCVVREEIVRSFISGFNDDQYDDDAMKIMMMLNVGSVVRCLPATKLMLWK